MKSSVGKRKVEDIDGVHVEKVKLREENLQDIGLFGALLAQV